VFRILIVDDNDAFVYLLQRAFQKLARSCEVHWRQNGVEALDFLRIRDSQLSPDLILLDMNMPRMNGLETLRAIKNDPALSVIPVIVLSASTPSQDIRKVYQEHANCFIRKTSDLDGLTDLVRAIEAFWMNYAVPAPGDSASGPKKGTSIAGPELEEISAAASSDGSIVKMSSAVQSGCDEHMRLMNEYAASTKQLMNLHEEQFRAILEGDPECNRFDLLIHMANEKKQEVKYAYLRHVESHGCLNFNAFVDTTGT
jgi:two-component system, chemotaxis family, response regulator Rcp1